MAPAGVRVSSNTLNALFFPQELETRIDTQKQTLQARDESIKKLLEMLQSKGEGESAFGVAES